METVKTLDSIIYLKVNVFPPQTYIYKNQEMMTYIELDLDSFYFMSTLQQMNRETHWRVSENIDSGS